MTKARKRMTPEQRKNEILQAAILLAEAEGIESLTRDEVASEADCAVGLVSHYFNPFEKLLIEVQEFLDE